MDLPIYESGDRDYSAPYGPLPEPSPDSIPAPPNSGTIVRTERTSKQGVPSRAHGPATLAEYHRLARAARRKLHVRGWRNAKGVRLQSARDAALVALLYVLGLKGGEVSQLDADDYDPMGRTLTVGTRTLPTPGHVGDALDLLTERLRGKSTPLLPASDFYRRHIDRRGSSGFAATVVDRLWGDEEAGGPPSHTSPTPQDFRRAFATYLRAQPGITVNGVAETLGTHSRRRGPRPQAEDHAVSTAMSKWEVGARGW